MAGIVLLFGVLVGIVALGGAEGALFSGILTWGLWPLTTGENPGEKRIAAMVVVLTTAAVLVWQASFLLACLVASSQIVLARAWRARQDEKAALRTFSDWID